MSGKETLAEEDGSLVDKFVLVVNDKPPVAGMGRIMFMGVRR